MDQNDESQSPRGGANEGASRLLHDATRRDARRLVEFAGASLGAASEADALVVETLAGAFREAGASDESTLETTALFASLRRRCAQALERRRRAPLTPADERVGPGGRTRALLAAIRPSEREALLLRYVGGLSTAEVARVCGIDVELAEARVSRALASLCRAARPVVEASVSLDDSSAERREVEERLAGILDGTAAESVVDFVSGDDASRDFVHDAERLVEVIQGLEADRAVDTDAILRAVLAAERETAEPATEPPPAEPNATEVTAPEPPPAEPIAAEVTVPDPNASATRSDTSQATEPMPGKAAAASSTGTPPAKPAASKTEPMPAKPAASKTAPSRWGAKPRLAAAAVATAVVAVFAWAGGRTSGGRNVDPTAAWSGKIADVSRAFGDSRGLERCSPDGAVCAAADTGDDVPAGSILRTNTETRAVISLSDGTRLVVDRATELRFDGEHARRARLESGALVAEIADMGSSRARLDVPLGFVESGDAKWSLAAGASQASLEVVRGAVRLADAGDHDVTVHAGEVGRLEQGGAPAVSSTAYLGNAFRWSERAFEKNESGAGMAGLGELHGKKPGEDREREHAVELASHTTRVRIVGNVARTEVDEVFQNDTDDVLEGIFRFPLPADAQIERLALDVDGKLEDGAFVDRDRAASIWRGAIVNAGAKKPVGEEIVWVPGPWRDPALLEWQRGGRFELHVFPIPKRGTRHVVLAYTEVIPPAGATRRYVYPLAHDPSGGTRIGSFDVDVEVRGFDPKNGVLAGGYAFEQHGLPDGATSFHLSREHFVPNGDVSIEFSLPDADRDVTAYAYQPSPDDLTDDSAAPGAPLNPQVSARTSWSPNAGVSASDPFVALAIRPKLPSVADEGQRAFALVVDSSRSMFGERYRRAAELATRLVAEMDRGDRVTVLACDSTCRALPSGAALASPETAERVGAFLRGVTPEGGSDITAAIRTARDALRGVAIGGARVVYIGDGTPTIGAVTPAFVKRDVEATMPAEIGTVTAVAIGTDADVDTLTTLASSAGGVVVPYTPGQPVLEAAYAVLGATYGSALRDVEVDVPDGFADVSPRKLGAIPAGGEVTIAGRLTRADVEGTVVLRGKLGREPFERRYPIHVVATTSKGNAFVPRLYAANRIAELEEMPDADSRRQAIDLSTRYHVASRYTSLLVLESTAMYRAFGVKSDVAKSAWTGEDDAESTGADAEPEFAAGTDATAHDDRDEPKGGGARLGALGDALDGEGASASATAGASGGMARQAPMRSPPAAAPSPAPAMKRSESEANAYAPSEESDKAASATPRGRAFAEPPPPADLAFDGPAKPQEVARAPLEVPMDHETPPGPGWSRRWVPMRKIWERVGHIVVPATPSLGVFSGQADAIERAERDVATNASSRDAVKKLYTLYFMGGDVERASAVAERWSEKDPLDPDALTARADVAAARGDRDLAIRILGSVVDVRPGDHKAQWRLARLHRWAGRAEVGCRHSMAVAQIRSNDGKLLAEAVRCERDVGDADLASDLLAAADDATRRAATALLAQPATDPFALRGDLRLDATWAGGVDLDLAMVSSEGRISWLGAPTRAVISARDVLSGSRESLALQGASNGDYVVEITRPAGRSGAIRGMIEIAVPGDHRQVPFVLDGDRARVAMLKISSRSRLVPL